MENLLKSICYQLPYDAKLIIKNPTTRTVEMAIVRRDYVENKTVSTSLSNEALFRAITDLILDFNRNCPL